MNGENMSMRDVRTVTRVVGRRTAMRYLALGVGASLIAACKGGSGTDGANGITGGDGQPTVTGRAFAAFMRGRWSVTSEIGNEDPAAFTAVIDDGVWSLESGGQSTKGTWSLSGGRLSLQVPEHLGSIENPGDLEEAAATNVPAAIGDSLSVSLPWQPPGSSSSSGETLSVDYAGNTLRIRHIEGDNMNTFTCIRA